MFVKTWRFRIIILKKNCVTTVISFGKSILKSNKVQSTCQLNIRMGL